MAFFKASAKEPSLREKFTNLVMDGKSILRKFLRRNVGIRCNKYNLAAESLIILETSSSLMGSKALKTGGAKVGASVEEPAVRNVSQIWLILSKKIKQTCLGGFYLSNEQAE